MARRVELWDPSPEGALLAEVLRVAGVQVVPSERGELGSRGELAVMALDQPGGPEALAALARAGGHVPVVVVGGVADGEALPDCVEAVLTRPVRHDALLVRVRAALARARSSPREAVTEHWEASQALAGPTAVVAGESAPGAVTAQWDEPAPVTLADAATVEGATLSAELAAELARAFEAASVRAPLWLEGQTEPGTKLLPDALLGGASSVEPWLEEEEELTPLELALPARERQSVPPPRAARRARPAGEAAWLAVDDPRLGNLLEGRDLRVGVLGPLGLAVVVWRIVELGLDAELRLASAPPLSLRFLAGGLRELEGPVFARALSGLGEEAGGELDEGAAKERLRARIAGGESSELSVDRALRVAREGHLAEALVAGEDARFELAVLTAPARERLSTLRRPLGDAVCTVLARAARARLSLESLARFAPQHAVVHLSEEDVRRLDRAHLEPELVELLRRHAGGPLSGLLAETEAGDGVAGLLCLAAVLDAVRFVTAPD